MDIHVIEKHFKKIGARVKFGSTRWLSVIDILEDQKGEYFDIKVYFRERIEYEVINLQKDMRHLLLIARRAWGKEKFLCGFDERHWFVAAVPGRSVTNVKNAMEALQPAEVKATISQKVRRNKKRFLRRNEAFIRQGEWFFVPRPDLDVNPSFVKPIFKYEPISRDLLSKPHICEEVFREEGETVWVCLRYPNGISVDQYEKIMKTEPMAKTWNWQLRTRDANVFARGTVRHPDHKTINLDCWHQIFMNTENETTGRHHIAFLD